MTHAAYAPDDTEEAEAYAVLHGHVDAKVFVTCEHATQRMPTGWRWPDEDRRLVDTHWAFDLGALTIATDFARAMHGSGVSSRFTRLLVDPNRPETSETLFRDRAEGLPVVLNTGLDEAERARRIETLLRPYHAAVDAQLGRARAPTLVSMHTFTPLYEGQPRVLEVGILFDLDEAPAARVAEALVKRGLHVELNEPYSGKDGLMYAVDRHARAHGREAIELEVRQDLAMDDRFREDFGGMLREIFG